jgi:hypothetical protein
MLAGKKPIPFVEIGSIKGIGFFGCSVERRNELI